MSQMSPHLPQDVHTSAEPASATQPLPRKPYHPPQLEVVGNIRELTQTTSEGGIDDGAGTPVYISTPT
jgi:hypothetical protein